MPVSITDDATQFPAVTTPAGADVPNAASVQTTVQQLANRTAWLKALGAGSGFPLSESFDGTTFPPASPTGVWAAPSPRFASDLAYVRDTSTPISGTASANRPSGQTASTNSSLGLTVFLTSPSRLAFLFSAICNIGQSDHLDFYVDGVLTAEISSRTGPTTEAGRWVTDPLREGLHTFDWRFVRGASASVGSEQAKIDTVEIIPESAWLADGANRFYWFDDLLPLSSSTSGVPVGMAAGSSANAGSVTPGALITGGGSTFEVGATQVRCSATAIGDWEQFASGNIATGFTTGANGMTRDRAPVWEARISIGSLTNIAAFFGLADASTTDAVTNGVELIYDSTLGANWRLRVTVASAATTIDTGIAAAAAPLIARICVSSIGATLSINGKMIPGAGAALSMCFASVPAAGVGLSPRYRVTSRTAAGQQLIDLDWHRFYSLRT